MLRPNEAGYTYDGRLNGMLSSRYRSRLDRVLVKLNGWRLGSIEVSATGC